ncbi:NifU family protein [Aeromicrobium sp.]|uniref:NifU family protein n=1 Tax=Aeromicrobium sp. TaxID=1871063 RepID=UPI001998B448|nr:NifU family protein [Aeromicrobium sp.]MBC7631841.1 NifU family protein [Aeromicrobium sp.]
MTQLADSTAVTLPEDRSVEDLAEVLDQATSRLVDLDPLPKQVAEDLRSAGDDLHRAALVHLIRGLRDDPRGKELLFDLVDEPRLRMVLLMHGLIRPDPMSHAATVLESVRPMLQSHGGDVELVRIEDGTAYVRLSGACNGCSMSAVTMRNGVEQALVAEVPGVSAVEVLPNEPGPTLIPLSEFGKRPGELDPGWAKTLALDSFALGSIVPVDVVPQDGPSVEAVVVNISGQLSAFVNACAHLGNTLDDADIDVERGTLTCSWHGYCFDALSGECQTLPGAQLDQLPLRVEDGHVWIRTTS